MPYFSYKAVDKNGAVLKGGIETETAGQVNRYLELSGLAVVYVKKTNILNMNLSDIGLFKRRLGKKEIAYICRQTAFVLKSGLGMSAGFDVLIDNSLNNRMKKCFTGMKADLLRGADVSSCFNNTGVFPAFLVNMILVGERTDNLDKIMGEMADFYEKDAKISAEITAAAIYPVFVAILMTVVVIAALLFVVPGYARTFLDMGADLPLPTRILIGISGFLTDYWRVMAVFSAVIAAGALAFGRTAKGRYAFDIVRLKNHVTGGFNTKNRNLYFAESMSMLLSSGADIVSALEIEKAVLDNSACDRQIDLMINKIRAGSKLSATLAGSELFAKILYSMIKLGEETDKLPETLSECSKYLRNELDASVNKMKGLIQPISTIALGLILAFIVLATMLPSIQMTSFF